MVSDKIYSYQFDSAANERLHTYNVRINILLTYINVYIIQRHTIAFNYRRTDSIDNIFCSYFYSGDDDDDDADDIVLKPFSE